MYRYVSSVWGISVSSPGRSASSVAPTVMVASSGCSCAGTISTQWLDGSCAKPPSVGCPSLVKSPPTQKALDLSGAENCSDEFSDVVPCAPAGAPPESSTARDSVDEIRYGKNRLRMDHSLNSFIL